MTSCCIILLALLLPPQTYLATASGQILDREGKPLAGALVIYKNIGIINRNIRADPGMRSEAPTLDERTGRIFKVKTDRKGVFTLVGLDYGVYDVEITAPDGSYVYSGRKNVLGEGDPNAQNVLNVDLSLAERGPIVPGAETNLASGKKTKEQLELIRQENINAEKINRLIVRFHAAVGIEDWLGASKLMESLIALDSNRWEFYQNLGTLQSNLMNYEEAARSFAKGVEVAQKTLKNPSDTDRALTNIGDLLLAEADCYNRLERVDEAVALYEKAAQVYPHPFMARYRACNALTNRSRTEAAIEKCTQAAADDPTQWEPYQVLGGIFQNANQPNEALEAYGKGIDAAQKMLDKPDALRARSGLGQMLNAQGNLLLQLKKTEEAMHAFSQAAEVSVYPAMPYFNLCALYYNQKRSEDAIAACDKAIAADPTMADAYYIKATLLFGQGKLEQGKYSAPAGTREALEMYMKYAGFGEHARDVRAMLDQLNAPADTTHKRSPR